MSLTKKLTVLFAFGVVGIVFSLGMTIFTAVQEHQEKSQPAPMTIPTPAIPASSE